MAVDEDGRARELLGEQEHPLHESVVAGDRIVSNYLVDASASLKTFSLDGAEMGGLDFEAAGSVDYLSTSGARANPKTKIEEESDFMAFVYKALGMAK